MSKMSQLHLTLDEQAVELGFEGLGEALMKGYDVDYEEGKLVRRGLGYSETVEHLTKEQEKAHEAWLKEQQAVLFELKEAVGYMEDYTMMPTTIPTRYVKAVRHAIEFVEGCHD